MSEQKQYIPRSSAKEKVFPDGGSIIRLGFKADELIRFVQANTNAQGYINLCVSRRRQPSEKGETHSVYLDTWQPNGNRQQQTQPRLVQRQTSQPMPMDNGDDVPF